jgi:hypothetical protein
MTEQEVKSREAHAWVEEQRRVREAFGPRRACDIKSRREVSVFEEVTPEEWQRFNREGQ